MNKNVISSLMVIILSVLLIGGILAWFTTTADPFVNEFTAGTIFIEADSQIGVGNTVEENWNPGDCTEIDYSIINQGSKSVFIRAKIEEKWIPSLLRMLVVYNGKNIQLLVLEWDSTNKGFTSMEGPIATGMFNVSYPSNTAYINGRFSNLSNQDWIQNNTIYSIWCVDKNTIINTGWYNNAQIFDPYSNPDWYNEVDTQESWTDIPWNKITYIINQNYLNQGYTISQVQDAIWHFTNGITVSGGSLEIVEEVNANSELTTDNVTITLGTDWIQGPDGYWYYTQAVPGTYSNSPLDERLISLSGLVCLDGPSTGNEYQGAIYWMTVYFEAIQSSNEASIDAWGWSPLDNP